MEKLREWQQKTLKMVFVVFRFFFTSFFCFFFFFSRCEKRGWEGEGLNFLSEYSLARKVKKHLHPILSEQLHGKMAGNCPKQLWFIVLSLIMFSTCLYNRPVLQSLSFNSLCYYSASTRFFSKVLALQFSKNICYIDVLPEKRGNEGAILFWKPKKWYIFL